MHIRECRVDRNIYKVAEPFCIEGVQVDGNNVLEVYETGKKAVEQCRKGGGPVFIECLTYRLRGHVGPDDNIQGSHTDIRPKQEVDTWSERDPIKAFETYLLGTGLVGKETLEEVKREAEKEVTQAHRFAVSCPHPKAKELIQNVFK
jgi:pyruvate dehydrogenase E1 component alpha subunit